MRGRVNKAVVGDDGSLVVGESQGSDDGLDVWYRWGAGVDEEGVDSSGGQGGRQRGNARRSEATTSVAMKTCSEDALGSQSPSREKSREQ